MPGRKRGRTPQGLAEFANDPAHVEMKRQSEAEDTRLSEQFDRDVHPVIEDLQRAGFAVESLEELRKLGTDNRHWLVGSDEYDRAVPILIEHLKRPYPDHVAGALAAAVAVPGAEPNWESLKSLYRAESRILPKEQLAYAMAVSAPDAKIDELIDLVRDPSNGVSRFYLLAAFDGTASGYRASRQARFAEVVDDLRSDPDLRRAIEGLRWSSRPRQRSHPHQVDSIDTAGLSETSAAFDVESLGRFLAGLVDLGIGFQQSFATEVRAATKELEPEGDAHFQFELDQRALSLLITVHMDDVASPDVWLFARADVIDLISRLIEREYGDVAN